MEVIDAEYQWFVVRHNVRGSLTMGDDQGWTKIDILFRHGETHRLPRARARIIPVRLYIRLLHSSHSSRRLYKTRIWMASLQGPGGYNSNKAPHL